MPRKKRKCILGIDPGIHRTGYGVVVDDRGTARYQDAGLIETSKLLPHERRLTKIHRAVGKLITKYRPAGIAIEQLFFCTNTKTALAVGEARGVILLAAGESRIPIMEFTPLQVKQAVTGYGKADKHQVQQMVKQILGLNTIPKPDDVADGLAIAICGTHTKGRGL